MDKKEIERIIFDALEVVNAGRNPDDQIIISSDAKLFGKEGQLDSMGLVALLIEIEETLQSKGYQVFLGDESAMSLSRSPFESVTSLIEFISNQLSEAHVNES